MRQMGESPTLEQATNPVACLRWCRCTLAELRPCQSTHNGPLPLSTPVAKKAMLDVPQWVKAKPYPDAKPPPDCLRGGGHEGLAGPLVGKYPEDGTFTHRRWAAGCRHLVHGGASAATDHKNQNPSHQTF